MRDPLRWFLQFLVIGPILLGTSADRAAAETASLTGIFSIHWGDAFVTGLPPQERYFLYDNNGTTTQLSISPDLAQESGGLLRYNGKMTTVTYELPVNQVSGLHGKDEGLHVLYLKQSVERQTITSVLPIATGAQPWVTIMCKFQDVSTEPKDLSYFQNMYASSYPGLDHYWREASYNRANVSGSTAHGWYVLPQPRSAYVYDDNGDGYDSLDFTKITQDCTGVADADVNFPSFVGINMMFNAELDGYAWGGSKTLFLDGETRQYRVTWEPPWGYKDITVIAHEMGHGFGMPHSSGMYGKTYDNVWDVMSDTWEYCSLARHPVYGCLGQHTIAYHRQLVGWLQPNEVYSYNGTSALITLEQLTQPTPGNYLLAKIPINGSSTRFYTVETRNLAGYDIKLPAEAVIIHEVDLARQYASPALVIDIDNNGDTGDSGARWDVGEVFTGEGNICVKILEKYSSSYLVQVGCEPPPPSAGLGLPPGSLQLLLLK